MWRHKYKLLVLFILGLLLILLNKPVYSISPHPNLTGEGKEATELVQQGRELYTAENFAAAVEMWLLAAENYAQLGDSLNQAMTLTYLSLAYQQLGAWEKAEKAINYSLTLLKENTPTVSVILAQTLNSQGRLLLNLGNLEAALTSLKQATEIYQQLGDETGVTGSLINQAQVWEALGFHRRTCQTLLLAIGKTKNCDWSQAEELTEVITSFKSHPQLTVLGLRSLGNIFRLLGNFEQSQHLLQETRTLPQSEIETSLTLLASGKTETALYKKYLELYNRSSDAEKESARQKAIASATSALAFYQAANSLEAQLQHLNLLIELNEGEFSPVTNPTTVASSLAQEVGNLPPIRPNIYAQLNFALSLSKLGQHQTALEYASKAKTIAEQLGDIRATSYALGVLGKIAESSENWELARENTEKALALAQSIQAEDLIYQWFWLLGRIYQKLGEKEKAIAAYKATTNTLESVRSNLLNIDSEIQFSFRDNIEPVYREFADILLQLPQAEDLIMAREVIENLQIAELENFLQCKLETNQTITIDKIIEQENSQTAIIYPIIFDNRIEIIVKLANHQELQHYTIQVPKNEVNKVIEQLENNLTYAGRKKQVQENAQKLEQWLIAPIKPDLENNQIDTLVFVLDSELGNIPMSVLYDGEKYLIEDYAISVELGLQLLSPQNLAPKELNIILAGLTQERQGFPPLINVKNQFEKISTEIESEIIIDASFTAKELENKIQTLPHSVVHIATHGKFSSNPQETFMITWDEKIGVNQLKNLFKSRETTRPNQPIELLVLAACETSKGDKRATLGLAGIALNTGVRSALSTLWKISADESPGELLAQFYRELKNNPDISKAEALRRAQLQFLHDNNHQAPYYWAAYILVGNWL